MRTILATICLAALPLIAQDTPISPNQIRQALADLRLRDPQMLAALARETPELTYANWISQAPHISTMKTALRISAAANAAVDTTTTTQPAVDISAVLANVVFVTLAHGPQAPTVPPVVIPPVVIPPVPPVTGTPVYNGDHPGALPSDTVLKAAPYNYPAGKLKCVYAIPPSWTVTEYPNCGMYTSAGVIQ